MHPILWMLTGAATTLAATVLAAWAGHRLRRRHTGGDLPVVGTWGCPDCGTEVPIRLRREIHAHLDTTDAELHAMGHER